MEDLSKNRFESTETDDPAFDYLVGLISPLTERFVIDKLSADVDQPYDSYIYRHETPAIKVADNSQVQICVYQESKVDPASGESWGRPIYTEMDIKFVEYHTIVNPQTSETSEIAVRRSETYARSELADQAKGRLLEVIAHYKAAVRQLSTQDARSEGFSDQALSFLGLGAETFEIQQQTAPQRI